MKNFPTKRYKSIALFSKEYFSIIDTSVSLLGSSSYILVTYVLILLKSPFGVLTLYSQTKILSATFS